MPCRYEALGASGSLFPDLLNPGARGPENLKIHASVWRGISTTALLSILRRLVDLLFVFIFCLFCVSLVYICIAYQLLIYS